MITRTIITLILFSLITWPVHACLLITPDKILVIRDDAGIEIVEALSGDCSSNDIKTINGIISQQKGKVSLSTLAKRYAPGASFSKQFIIVNQLGDVLSERQILPHNVTFNVLNTRGTPAFLALANEEASELSCPTCNKLGNGHVRLSIKNPVSGIRRDSIIHGITETTVNAWVAKKHVSASIELLNPSDFVKKLIHTSEPESVFPADRDLDFHRLTRKISKGEHVMNNHLFKKDIVRYNQPVDVIFKTGNIELKAKALPLQSGKINDIVKFKLINGGNTSAGRIIGINKLKVDL